MTETVIHVVGNVGSDVTIREVGNGTHLTTFRLAATPRYWDRSKGQFVDGTTNWLSVQCWRGLAEHVHRSVKRGDPVIVVGRLRTTEWTKDEERYSRFVVEATTVGHDLARGHAAFTKSARQHEAAPDFNQAALRALQEIEGLPETENEARDSDGFGPRLADAS